ncbi:MAG TPA: hypothetical protein VHM19_01735 [Polyangiales bacterium]|jgi:tetratricopeptide (TPR) repeat protein|nr:hypothetical protein [Polyangiales bacterium]
MTSHVQSDLVARLAAIDSTVPPTEGKAQLDALLAEARAAGDRLAVGAIATSLAKHFASMGDWPPCRDMLALASAELSGFEAPIEHARLAVARSWLFDAEVDVPALEHALPILEACGLWVDASACARELAFAARTAGRPETARPLYLRAIGAAEATGQRLGVASLVRALADLETSAGAPARADALLRGALMRLAPVMLLGARRAEALCIESLGDAHLAQERPADARRCYEEAIERLDRIEAGGVARVKKKLERIP